ncbi:hypothetical protein A3SI_00205 [Nitritalea halalkaliphila LW7]|uniref:X-Pro dipeptidyl-peptidase n=2 Tax=Nitritalea TaxID=1187887 RepID=I5CAK1_9BACT|nr:hypothetical protein A3SI_00205 [Nitritalea halalkaliphila LW7]
MKQKAHQDAYTAFKQVADVLDFDTDLQVFIFERKRAKQPDAATLAGQFDVATEAIRQKLNALPKRTPYPSWQEAALAAQVIRSFKRSVEEAYQFYFDYDPAFTWWIKKPMEELSKQADHYAKALEAHYASTSVRDDGSGIIGLPIGKAAIDRELEANMIPYSAEELIREGEKQYAWCEAEMIKASQALGYGTNWLEALEHVKNQYLPPGEWPQRVVEMAEEAITYMQKNDLISLPEVAIESWRTTMLSAERQRVSPFFLGGESILIAYPTSEMSHADKLMSLRGNNPHFARAVVHHELIPGHHLQQFMNQRHFPHRRLFNTPFWVEGWTLYWEFNLWDKGFATTPEDKIGMLFWRMHRAARIVFSLKYHLGEWTPQQCIDFLVDRVGHERANAEAEVRRSFEGNYGPLYQLAYMIGGIQVQRLRTELVENGKMSEKEFHDFFIRQNYTPIALLRARMLGDIPENFKGDCAF